MYNSHCACVLPRHIEQASMLCKCGCAPVRVEPRRLPQPIVGTSLSVCLSLRRSGCHPFSCGGAQTSGAELCGAGTATQLQALPYRGAHLCRRRRLLAMGACCCR